MLIGIDLGGTKTELIALNLDHSVQLRRRVPTPNSDYDSMVRTICDLITSAELELGQKATVGVGIPGSRSPITGLIRNANTTCMNGKDLYSDLVVGLNREIRIANDANCFALSEAIDGAAEGSSIVFGVILGTGCGGGLVVNKNIVEGANRIAGEWGHTRLPWLNREELTNTPCYCGLTDCTETFLSGPGWSRRYNTLNKTSLNANEIVQLALSGNPTAQAGLAQYADYLARGLASVINLLDPDAVVLGGGLSNINFLYKEVPKLLKKYVFSDTIDTKLLPPKYGDSSGVRGAAWLFRAQ